jgi:hypothetical protein
MNDLYKFGWLPNGETEERFEYANKWAREKTSGPDRLVIAPRAHYIDLLQRLAACLHEPFLLLYVLVVPRGEGEPGRYQNEFPLSSIQLQEFLASYSDFFEHDARHNLWIRSQFDDGLLVYDRHNLIYAYGPLERFIEELTSSGLSESEDVFMRLPHVHHYHEALDSDAKRLHTKESWIISPLRPGDENPD